MEKEGTKYHNVPSTILFVPPFITTLVIITIRPGAIIQCVTTQPFKKQKTNFELQVGGSHICLCHLNRRFYHFFLESKERYFRSVKVNKRDVMVLYEQVYNPFSRSNPVPSLRNLCRVNLFLQGHTQCDLLLEAPLLKWEKLKYKVTAYLTPYGKGCPFESCYNSFHKIKEPLAEILPLEFWDEH
jgi:hypothetical protein